jgi:uncharacterized HAD superfamily protein
VANAVCPCYYVIVKTIAIDIDNVLAASAESFVVISNRLFGDHITVDDFNEDWQKMWGINHDEAVRRAKILFEHQYQKGYLPTDGASKAINELSMHYNLVLVTSRKKISEDLTRNWLKQHFEYPFEEIVFADFWDDDNKNAKDGHLRHKGDLFAQVNADIVIDDQLKHCVAAAEQGMQVVLFGDYPWNQANELPDSIIRCKDWVDVVSSL